jgi:hypothetical protein
MVFFHVRSLWNDHSYINAPCRLTTPAHCKNDHNINHCVSMPTVGRFSSNLLFSNRHGVNHEKINIFIYLAIITSAVSLSACASKSEPVSEPAPVVVQAETPPPAVAEAPPAQAVVEEPVAANTQAEAPKKIKHKAKRKIVHKRVAPKVAAPAPVVEPAPVVVEKAPEVVPPAPPVVAAPAPVVAEEGFLEKYWLWLLGVLIAIVGIAFWWKKNQA